MRKKLFGWVLMLVFLISLAGSSGTTAHNDASPFIWLVRTIESDQMRLSHPSGLAYSLRSDAFLVVKAVGLGGIPAASTDIVNLGFLGNRVGSTRILAAVQDPINMAFDDYRGRLLIYQSPAGRLIEVQQNPDGILDPKTLTRHDVRHFGVGVPQGMSVDPISGYLYILDAKGPRIVIVEPGQDGSFEGAVLSELTLPATGLKDVRGLAYDGSTGHLHVLSVSERQLFEITLEGVITASRDLSGFGLVEPQGMVFAPSGDLTDDPGEMSLYLADRGGDVQKISTARVEMGGEELVSDRHLGQNPGQIVEFSLQAPLGPAEISFDSTVLNVTDMSSPSFDPPSPDPSGLAYLPGRNNLVMVDGEVEETIDGITHFEGVNLWEITLGGSVVDTANISTVPPTKVSMSDEPTGVAWNPGNGHYYFADDVAKQVFDLNPGADRKIGTPNDTWNRFGLHVNNTDPEGIAYNPNSGRLYVADGVSAEIFTYLTDGSFVGNFDVELYGVRGPESVEYNPDNDSLLILGASYTGMIIETTTDGELLRTIDISAAGIANPAGLAYAPDSNGSGAKHFYIVDRGLDNNQYPTSVDGKMFEMTAPSPITPGNQLPFVDAGPDRSITLPTNSVLLDAAVSDDGVPDPPGEVTSTWSQVDGPCQVDFADPNKVDTTATFQYPGSYRVRLTADDGELTPFDEAFITVQRDPSVNEFDLLIATDSDDAEESASGSVRLRSVDLELVNDDTDQQVGLRFNGVDIPRGATITSAYIQFTVDKTSSEGTSLTIQGEDGGDALPFVHTGGDISSRPKTTAQVSWNPDPWTTVGEAGPDQQTADISPVIQEIIGRFDWSRGNSLAIIITGTGKRTAVAYDGDPCEAPRLHLEFAESANTPPTAVEDAYSTNENEPLNVAAPGVLDNDSDGDEDSLTANLVAGPENGTLTLNHNGSFAYTPDLDYQGTDSFIYSANDGLVDSNPVAVTITVYPVNNTSPVANFDMYTVGSDSTFKQAAPGVLENDVDADGDKLIATLVSDPTHGMLTLNSDGSFQYTPDAQFIGTDSFDYIASDGFADSNIAKVTIFVTLLDHTYIPMISK